MLSLSMAQIDAWIAFYAFPLARILGLVATAPLWSTAGIPRRTRLILGLGITIAIAPVLPPMPNVQPASLAGLWILGQQVLIGISMGFAARIVFSAIDMAGTYIGFQMGLGFATFYDPMEGAQTAVLAEFIGLIALLLFMAFDGHLLYISTLAQSFHAIPVGPEALSPNSWRNLAELGGKIFSAGLLLALPVLVALMITNVALGVLTKAAPQLNLFALGFPLTLMGGFMAVGVSLNYLTGPLQDLYDFAIRAMLGFALPAAQ
ncbi:MAG: flagellar biosynthetic protein FliR [Dechloromonas sp.]|jgi:flagellar biosynthetic protein FliR|uniref:Flagellar biosynthetic protein FliR n=1 Tax=Azonexus hydrophilus TaxID=418702 RepID=A0ABZ2XGB2_9RHOO|nr:flagellar biosynthetic protein FliR [Azonexus hydrophilus]MBS4016619.1 flagellar biosynthetic protein FliR [Dechloromonas sp.]MCA1937793.1 flagellar biosynthetic protein FliR [Dechloromonas sp.]